MEDDAPPAQRLDEGAALQQVVDAVQPLVLLEARHTDVVRRVDGQGNVPLGTGGTERSGLSGQPHAAPALVLKCRQAKARRVGGDGGGVKLFDCVAVGQTGLPKRGVSFIQLAALLIVFVDQYGSNLRFNSTNLFLSWFVRGIR